MVPGAAAEARQMTGKRRFVAHRDGARRRPAARRSASRRTCGRRPRSAAASTFAEQPAAARAYREYLTIVSHTDVRNAEAFTPPEIGGDHFRSAAVFLTQAHPHQTQGSDLKAGTSIDQLYAQQFGQETPIPSMQLCIENVDQAGGCFYGYSCAYTDSISWALAVRAAADDSRPARGVRSAVRRRRDARGARRAPPQGPEHPRLGHRVGERAEGRRSAPPTARASRDYLDDVREIERRIQKVEAFNASGEPRELPGAPIGVPDSYDEHVKLMFDLQAIAFASDITRVFAFKMSRDVSNRVYPEAGVTTGFHIASHHSDRDERILEFAKINRYHVSLLPYFLDQLKTGHGRRHRPARQHAGRLRLADGQPERAQPQALPAAPARARRRRGQGQPAPRGGRRHADGQRDAVACCRSSGWTIDELRRQHRRHSS